MNIAHSHLNFQVPLVCAEDIVGFALNFPAFAVLSQHLFLKSMQDHIKRQTLPAVALSTLY